MRNQDTESPMGSRAGIDILKRKRKYLIIGHFLQPILWGGHTNGSFNFVAVQGRLARHPDPARRIHSRKGRINKEAAGHTGPDECTNTAPPELRGAAQEPPCCDGSMRGTFDEVEVDM